MFNHRLSVPEEVFYIVWHGSPIHGSLRRHITEDHQRVQHLLAVDRPIARPVGEGAGEIENEQFLKIFCISPVIKPEGSNPLFFIC